MTPFTYQVQHTITIYMDYKNLMNAQDLIPKGLEAIFQAFLKFGQAIVDAIFVQKISKFW
jgi:hypothetical protein